jgi:D-3-phosphoglycerate dehydrogenase
MIVAHRVLIPQDVSEEGKEYLRQHGCEVIMGSGITVDALKKDIADCDALLARTEIIPAEVLEAAPRLKVVGRHGVGVDNIDIKRAEELGIYVTNAPESNAGSVAEHTIGLIIACSRFYIKCNQELRNGNFEVRNQVRGFDVEGKTLGLIGVGRIGAKVANKAFNGLGLKVIACDPYIEKGNVPPEVERMVGWEDLFRSADFVSLHLPSVEETKGIVGRSEFNLMKSTAFLINTARGDLIDEQELVAALRKGKIAGAGLDVFEKEPPQPASPLLSLTNVVATPHNAALTWECSARMAVHAAMGIVEVLSGNKPTWPVNHPQNARR